MINPVAITLASVPEPSLTVGLLPRFAPCVVAYLPVSSSNSFKYPCQIAGSVCVPWPRV
jgi:hypothetical protein